MEKEEILYKLSIFEQQAQQIQQQLEMIESGVAELTNLGIGLEELNGKKDKDILAPIGSGIFVKANLLSEDLIVDIGGKNFIKKSIPETKEMIKQQIHRLEDVYGQLTSSLDEINSQVTEIIGNIQNQKEQN